MTKPVSVPSRVTVAGRVVLLALLALSAASLSACNTVQGAGADVSSLGRGVTGAASGTKAAITP
jgi:predicted small secreted protein